MGVRVIASTENGMRVHRISANRRRQTPGCGVQTAAGSLEAVFESSDVERFVWILTEVFDQFDEAGINFSLGTIRDDEALPLAGAPQLRFDRQDDRIEIRPVAPSSSFKRRGDFRAVHPDVDPIGRNGYPFDNVQDEAFHLDGRHGEPSLGKRASVAQGRIKRVRLKIERCERITDVGP